MAISHVDGQCACHRCIKEKDLRGPGPMDIFPLSGTMMIVCEHCGNKRCPHATDHDNPCTNSNDPGQPGSAH